MQLMKHNYIIWEANKRNISILLYHQAIAFAAWSMTVGGRVRLNPRELWILQNSLVHCSCATESDGIMESTSGWVPGTWNLWMNTDCHARWELLLGVVNCLLQMAQVCCIVWNIYHCALNEGMFWTPVYSKMQVQWLMVFKLYSSRLQMVWKLIWNGFHVFYPLQLKLGVLVLVSYKLWILSVHLTLPQWFSL